MVLPPESKLPKNLSVMASSKSQPLPTLSLSCLKLERDNPSDTNCSDSLSNNQNNLGTDPAENGTSYTWGVVSEEKPTILKIVIHRGEKNLAVASEKGMQGEGQDKKELGQRTWNLRPRNTLKKPSKAISGKTGISNPSNNLESEEKLEQPNKLLFTLTREEIEADFLAMTGSKPPRKTKRRPKNVQNVIDVRQSCNMMPCLYDMLCLLLLDF